MSKDNMLALHIIFDLLNDLIWASIVRRELGCFRARDFRENEVAWLKDSLGHGVSRRTRINEQAPSRERDTLEFFKICIML
jgi:hypothetical protein